MKKYKKLKKGRNEQISYIYDIIKSDLPSKDGHSILTYDKLFMGIDINWRNLFPIYEFEDAHKVCKRILKRVLYMDSEMIELKDLISIYVNLAYLEDFINNSLIQNNIINKNYSFIKDYLYRYESGLSYIKIKYWCIG